MARYCTKCMFAIAAGLAVGAILAVLSHNSYLWVSLGLGLGIGTCMALGETSATPESSG